MPRSGCSWSEFQLKKQQKQYMIADGLIERTSPMLDEMESKIMHKYKGGDQQREKK